MNTTTATHKRILLLGEASSLSELESLALSSGWPLVGRFPQSFDESVEIQWDAEAGVSVAYIEFHSDGARMLSVRGEDSQALDGVVATLTAALSLRDADALLDSLTGDPEPTELVRSWRELCLACAHSHPDQRMDPRLPDALATALAHPSRQVRLRALLFTDALGGRWPELMELVMARKDDESELGYVIEAFVSVLSEDDED